MSKQETLDEMFFKRHNLVLSPDWIIEMIESIYYPELEIEVTEEPDDGLLVPLQGGFHG
jgi:hypothetical protein